MKVYVSGSIEDEKKVIKIAKFYEENRHIITRRWWLFKSDDPEKKKIFANMDMKAIKECELFIMYNGEKITSERYIELGMAIILEKSIFIYGKKLTTIFRHNCYYKGENIRGMNI